MCVWQKCLKTFLIKKVLRFRSEENDKNKEINISLIYICLIPKSFKYWIQSIECLYIYIYIYIYMCVCVCVCVWKDQKVTTLRTLGHHKPVILFWHLSAERSSPLGKDRWATLLRSVFVLKIVFERAFALLLHARFSSSFSSPWSNG